MPEKATVLGNHLKNGLLSLQEKHPIIGDVRGLGLMLGAELIYQDKSPAIRETDIVLEKMKERGFLVGKNGFNRNVLAFQPPLIITIANIDDLLNHLDMVLSSIDKNF